MGAEQNPQRRIIIEHTNIHGNGGYAVGAEVSHRAYLANKQKCKSGEAVDWFGKSLELRESNRISTCRFPDDSAKRKLSQPQFSDDNTWGTLGNFCVCKEFGIFIEHHFPEKGIHHEETNCSLKPFFCVDNSWAMDSEAIHPAKKFKSSLAMDPRSKDAHPVQPHNSNI